MNKNFILMASAIILASAGFSSCKAQNTNSNEMTVTEALSERHSGRSFSDKALPQDLVMEVLWAGNGKNAHGRRTAPSAVNAQDIDLYLCTAEGVSKYNAGDTKLEKVTDEDIRPFLQAQNKFIMNAPVTILLVSDQTKFGEPRPGSRNMNFGLVDAGIVSENISLFCTAKGLATVCCMPRIREDEVRRALSLSERQIPILYHPVGYPAE
jgi:nitroreductase